MKIIRADNFDREGPGHDDELICENVSETNGKRIVNLLNSDKGEYSSPNYYRLVKDDHELWAFAP